MKKCILFVSTLFLICSFIQGQFASDTVSQSLKRAYTELANKSMYSVNYWIFGDDRSDIAETGGAFLGELPSFHDIMVHNVSNDNGAIKEYWYRGYTTIFFCNYAIANAPASGLNNALQNRIIAEAKFIRALIYFNLVNAFDSLPIKTNVFDWPIEDYSIDYNSNNYLEGPINSMSEVYAQIKTDLIESTDYLPHRDPFDYENRFRATFGAARSLLGKVYLFESSFAKNYAGDNRFFGFEENWDSALYCFEEVINSGDYYLVGSSGQTYDTWWDSTSFYPENTPAFRYIFTVSGNGSSEIILPAINLTPNQGWNTYGGNGIVNWTTVRNVSCSANSYAFGWGLNAPSQNLINLYGSETGNPKDDPRFIVTVGIQDDSVLTHTSGVNWCTMNFPSEQNFTAACRKYECTPDEFWTNNYHWVNSPIDIPVIRYSDVILMASEAALELGENTKALNYLNNVRSRARYSGNTGYPAELMAITFSDIVKERALELALEGHRFYDLVRWGIAADSLDGRIIANQVDTIVVFEEGIDEFLPIPAGAIGAPVGINENIHNNIIIFPNPSVDYINIVNLKNDCQIRIYDAKGRNILAVVMEKNNSKIDIQALPAGIYYLQLISDQTTNMVKFIKK